MGPAEGLSDPDHRDSAADPHSGRRKQETSEEQVGVMWSDSTVYYQLQPLDGSPAAHSSQQQWSSLKDQDLQGPGSHLFGLQCKVSCGMNDE